MTAGERVAVPPKVSLATVVLLICSLGLNLLLGLRVSKLNRTVESMRFGNDLRIGTQVPAIEGRVLGARPQDLHFVDSKVPTVIYVFRPDCGWCKRNLDNLRSLVAASGPHYRIVGLSLPSTASVASYLQMTQLNFPVYTDVAEASIQAYHLGGTPETIVVSPQSKVLRVWIGAYQGPMLKDIENYLGVPLQECCQTGEKGS